MGSSKYIIFCAHATWPQDTLPCVLIITVDGESFAGLNFRGFDPVKYFAEILSRFIGQECLCYIDNYLRGTRVKYSQKTFAVLFKTAKTMKVWPSESFPVYSMFIQNCLV